MSSAFSCCDPCPPGAIPSANVVNIPGPQGDPGIPGTDGTNGADGKDAYTTTLADVLLPVAGNNVSVACVNVAWMQVGQNVFMSGLAGVANFQVISRNTITNFAVLKFLEYNGDLGSGNTIAAGAGISPSGIQSVIPATAFFVSKFESSEYAMASGQLADVAHGLNGTPESTQAFLVSQDGSEGGYAINDKVLALMAMTATSAGQIETWLPIIGFGVNNLNVWLTYNPLTTISMATKGGGGFFNPSLTDASKWKVKVICIKLDAP